MSHQCLYNYETYIRSKQKGVETFWQRELSKGACIGIDMRMQLMSERKMCEECWRMHAIIVCYNTYAIRA